MAQDPIVSKWHGSDFNPSSLTTNYTPKHISLITVRSLVVNSQHIKKRILDAEIKFFI